MLQAVQVIHDETIVHSDLKPGNFVLVKGQLKSIDFGIANAIANDTTNVQRHHQVSFFLQLSNWLLKLTLTKENAMRAWDWLNRVSEAYRARYDIDAAAKAFEDREELGPQPGYQIAVRPQLY